MTSDSTDRPRVRQLRLVVTADDYEAALAFYRDVLGLPEHEAYQGEDGARVTILDAGRATLELSNPAQVRMIDAVEAEGSPSARIRVAFEVDDSAAVTHDLVRGGAELVASPRQTPWRSLNSRLEAPAGLQLTLFQELGPASAAEDENEDEPGNGTASTAGNRRENATENGPVHGTQEPRP
ncbi:VOC family protein [Planctomonas deserti]|uniref:VOC family protein n=1 Tax=Planctomonas deserti TaxID=2144185 RepID=UPI000D39D15F|nr:VOC family protein [Planctomonas deserti]